MRRILTYLGIFLIVSCSTTKNTSTDIAAVQSDVAAAGKLDRTQPPAPGPAPQIQLGEYENFQLDNGLKVYVVKNDKLPRISFSLQIDRDPILEGDKTGYISVFGDLWSRGTKSMTKAELDETIDFVGASFSTSSSGLYGSSLTRHTETVLGIMNDVLMNPIFPQEELDKLVKLSISDLISSKDDPGAVVLNIRDLVVYGADHPYGELISEASLKNITREDCIKYYQEYWSPKTAYLAVIGDITVDEARKMASEYFGDWTGDEIPSHEFEAPHAPEKTRVVMVDRPASVQSAIRVSYPVELELNDPDFFAARLMNTILGSGFSSRLLQNLREDNAFTYAAGSGITASDVIGKFTAGASVRNEVTDSAVHEILYELRNIAENGITDKELRSAKAYMTGGFARSLERPQTIAGFAINTAVLELPKDFYHTYLKRLNAVTIEDVNAAARKYIKPENAHIVVVGKASEVAAKLSRFGEIVYYDVDGNQYDPASLNKAIMGRSPESVIEDYIDAIGGNEAIKAVNSQKQIWAMTAFGQTMNVESIKTLDGKFRVDVQMGGQIRQSIICDGKDLVTLAGGSEMPMDDATKETEMLNNRLFPELYYAGSEIKLKLEGVEKINGNPAFSMSVIYPSGKESQVYFDTKSGLKVKEATMIDTPQGSYGQSVTYSDYKEVDGVLYPHSNTTQMGPQSIESSMTLLENNIKVDQAVFDLK